MAQLPVYRQQENISTEAGHIRDAVKINQGVNSMQIAGNALMQLAVPRIRRGKS